MKIKLGTKVKDKVSGLTGIATSKIEFLNGCKQYYIQPPVDDKGAPVEGEYVDDQQLENVKDPKPKKIKKSNTGGGVRHYPKRL